MSFKAICLPRMFGTAFILFLTMYVSGQVITVPSNRSGNIKVNENALPVLGKRSV